VLNFPTLTLKIIPMTDILAFRKQLADKHPKLEQVMRGPEPSLKLQAITQKFSQQLFLARAKQREGVVLKTPVRE